VLTSNGPIGISRRRPEARRSGPNLLLGPGWRWRSSVAGALPARQLNQPAALLICAANKLDSARSRPSCIAKRILRAARNKRPAESKD